MDMPNQRRARLSIDVEPELRRRVKIAAAAREEDAEGEHALDRLQGAAP